MANEILLEAGTNELELLVFRLGDVPFGINVAKVREIVQRARTIHVPHCPPSVEGSFRLRDRVLTLVNLGTHFGLQGDSTRNGEGMVIVVEFNRFTCGILVDAVERIYRLGWEEIEAPSPYLTSLDAPVTGVVRIGKEIVQVADFETIIGEILGVHSAVVPEDGSISATEGLEPETIRIVLADDSNLLRTRLVQILTQAGFTSLTVCNDGQEAWDVIQSRRDHPDGPCDVLLTDIEMPRMDGLHLTRRIKEDPALKDTVVILFSSLITEDNRNKGWAVGADAQISKPDSADVVREIRRCLHERAGAA